jgi:hypothetical protein
MSHRSLSLAAAAAVRLSSTGLLLVLAGCGPGPLLESDAGPIGPRDSGAQPDGGRDFGDGGGIGRVGLELDRVVPDYGPFTGGNTVILRGNGFMGEPQVTFDGHHVQPADHRIIDGRRLAVVVPAGDPGTVDVSVTVGDETVILEDGYTYDSIAVEPTSGSVSGGTYVTIIGSGTSFAEGDTVIFGRTE